MISNWKSFNESSNTKNYQLFVDIINDFIDDYNIDIFMNRVNRIDRRWWPYDIKENLLNHPPSSSPENVQIMFIGKFMEIEWIRKNRKILSGEFVKNFDSPLFRKIEDISGYKLESIYLQDNYAVFMVFSL